MSNEKLSEQDYLKKHLSDSEKSKNNIDSSINNSILKNTSNIDNLNYISVDVNLLPCGAFYPIGTTIMIRAAQVKEIQAFSTVDESNFADIVDKMNYILQSCVRIKYSNGKIASYLEIKDQDRIYLIFLIRELTFQQGNNLTVDAICPNDDKKIQIELNRENFVFHEIDSSLNEYFDQNDRCFKFQLINGKTYEISPPTIGIQKSFTDFMTKEAAEKRQPNVSFIKIIPFMLVNRSSITYEGIKSKLNEFENMDDISFQFLNSAVNKMKLGIKELKKNCECGGEVRTEMQFPNGVSSIFVIHDAFETYIKK